VGKAYADFTDAGHGKTVLGDLFQGVVYLLNFNELQSYAIGGCSGVLTRNDHPQARAAARLAENLP